MKLIKAISNKKELNDFIDFPHNLYKNDSNYVPELYLSQKELLNKKNHPFHEHAEVEYFLAYNSSKIVGRIAAILNHKHNEFNACNEGFFGFFECIDDQAVSQQLLKSAEDWLKQKNVEKIVGPANFSTNETCGLLMDSFHLPPVVMMPYNPKYYINFFENRGYKKKVDLIAYRFKENEYEDKSLLLKEKLSKRLLQKGIRIRCINKKRFKKEVNQIREVYNSAWNRNLGFVPMTENEFNFMAKDLKFILDSDFCMVAEKEGKIIGFSLAIPDLNQVLKKLQRGRLFPFGLIKLLVGKKKINGLRIIALGVVDGYRKLGIEACFYGSLIEAFRKKNFKYAEASWILEDNHLMNVALQKIKGEPYKRYRIFEKTL